jgi:KaiC/GvpD/RAD55 family RecA-like ATPase
VDHSLDQQCLENKIISFCLRAECYDRVKNILTKDMFEGEWATIWQALVTAHAKYKSDITGAELQAFFDSLYPAMPDSTRLRHWELFESLNDEIGTNTDLQENVIRDLWMRNRARMISELSVDIFLGKEKNFGELKRLIESTAEDSIGEKTTYTEVDMGLEELLDSLTLEPDFPFEWEPLSGYVPGLDRGHFGIIFARPETGKTTFVSFLAKKFLEQGLTVSVWGNEEPAVRTKLRIIQSFFKATRKELSKGRDKFAETWRKEIADRLHVLDCVGTTIQEIDDWCTINKPDIVFIDQLDKVKIAGKYNRGDEKLKEIYLQAREIAKRNKCLVWGVSQAGAEAESMMHVEYQYLDNSKTGKAGEADLIIGIGRTGDRSPENTKRYICISKNKQNGWHGTVPCELDMYRAVYEKNNHVIVVPPENQEPVAQPTEEEMNNVE